MKATVLGAGIVGAAIAYELTKQGVAVTLVDRGPVAELGASRWGFGGVSWASASTPSTIAFADRGFRRYTTMAAELGGPCGFRQCETLVLLDDTSSVAAANARAGEFRGRGHAAQIVTPAETMALEPALCMDGWAGALALSQGHLDLRRCARSWVARAAAQGMQLLEGVEVTAIEAGGERLRTSAGLIESDLTFIAGGAWARPLLRGRGLDLPLFHSHAEFLYSDPVAPLLRHQVSWGAIRRLEAESFAVSGDLRAAWDTDSWEELSPDSCELGIIQFEDGHVRVGQVSRLVPGYRAAPDEASRELIMQTVRAVWPGVDGLPNLRIGLRQVAFSGDHLPLVGPLQGLPNAILVAPSASPTVMAPAIGEAMAAFATGGAWDSLLDEWRLDRPGGSAKTALAVG